MIPLFQGDNLLTAIAVAGSSGMVGYRHRVIVIKANKNVNEDRPVLRYHVLGSEGVDQTLLCASTSSVGEIKTDILRDG